MSDDAFDVVLASCSIKHWTDRAAGVRELRRALRPDGTLVVVEMDRDATRADMRRFAAMTRIPRVCISMVASAFQYGCAPTLMPVTTTLISPPAWAKVTIRRSTAS